MESYSTRLCRSGIPSRRFPWGEDEIPASICHVDCCIWSSCLSLWGIKLRHFPAMECYDDLPNLTCHLTSHWLKGILLYVSTLIGLHYRTVKQLQHSHQNVLSKIVSNSKKHTYPVVPLLITVELARCRADPETWRFRNDCSYGNDLKTWYSNKNVLSPTA